MRAVSFSMRKWRDATAVAEGRSGYVRAEAGRLSHFAKERLSHFKLNAFGHFAELQRLRAIWIGAKKSRFPRRETG